MTTTEHLPCLVLVKLSRAGIIDSHSFAAVLTAFGALPDEGQLELVERLIEARRIYVINRIHERDRDDLPSKRKERLDQIGAASKRLLALLHRDGTDPRPWNQHPALESPALYRIVLERHATKMTALKAAGLGEPDARLAILAEILGDLVTLSSRAETFIKCRSPKSHGGRRKEGPGAAAKLIQALIEAYAALRARFPESGPLSAGDKALIRFVRAGLEFAVHYPPIFGPGGVPSERW